MSSSTTSLGPSAHSYAGPSSSYSTAFPPLQSIPWNFQQQHHHHHNHHNNNSNHSNHQHKKHSSHVNHQSSLYQCLAPPKYPAYLKHTLYADLALEQYNYYQNKRSFFPSDHNHHHHGNKNHHWGITTTSANHDSMPTAAESSSPSSESSSSKTHHGLASASSLSLSSSSSSSSQYAWAEEMDLRLPTCWNQKAKSRHIEIGRNGLDLSYIGPGKSEMHAAMVRANFPMRRQCGIYYYEMHVISKGDDGYIGFGFCGEDNELDRLPGWDANSYGYHGDDGHSFAGSGTGKTYGPCFTTGDVVGCGVNFAEGTAFYTKNGSFLGNAVEEGILTPDIDYYPCVGMRTPGEIVTVNFGNEPFVFDIVQYIKDCKTRCWKDITGKKPSSREKFSVPRPGKKLHDSSERLDQLVLSYLLHHGYTGAAKAVVRDSKHVSGKTLGLKNGHYTNEKDLEQRHNIRAAILAGNIDYAIELTQKYYPTVLKQGDSKSQDIMFELKCRKFVEMMREYSERKDDEDDDQTSVISNNSSGNHANCFGANSFSTSNGIPEDDVAPTNDVHNIEESYNSNNTGRDRRRSVSGGSFTSNATTASMRVPGRRRMSYAAIAASASPTNNNTMMNGGFLSLISSPPEHEYDEDTHGLAGIRRHRRLSTHRSSTGSSILSVNSNNNVLLEQDLETEDDEDEHSPISMKRIMRYGQQLQDEYRHDERTKIRERLVDIFSLLAYSDVGSSPVAHLMHKSGRDELATELNAVILRSQNEPDMPPLERIFRQAMVVNKELAYAKSGKAVILNVEEHCSASNNISTALTDVIGTNTSSLVDQIN